jgi:amidase
MKGIPRPHDFKPAFATAAETADAVRNKQISAVELVTETFERLDRHNPTINAIVWQCREQALGRAKQADEELARGQLWGPLHAVPVTIKEAFAYEGSPNSWGLPQLEDVRSPQTAVAVRRLEMAGAIVIGKTNIPVMLGDWQSSNPIYGTTNNPWDTTRTAGGSTGGGAAAIAAGLGCLTLGTDLSGSIRVPAHFCGVYGHKPSLGLISTAGVQPGPWNGAPGIPMDLSVVGPLARSAHDLALALNAIGGSNGAAAKAWQWHMPQSRHTSLEDFRVGYVLTDDVAPVTADLRSLYENTVNELRLAGAQLDAGWPDGIRAEAELKTYQYLLFSLMGADMKNDQREKLRARLESHPEDIYAAAALEPHGRWLQETVRRLAFRATWQKYFETHDVFLMPAGFTAAFPHDHSQPLEKRTIETPEGQRPYLSTPLWTYFATLAGLPATVAPIGRTSEGLPVGIQIVGPMWEDGTAIEFAALLAEVVGGFTQPEGFGR